MDVWRLGTILFILVLCCGDVESNPGPHQETSAKSEVLRRFKRCIQSELVILIYNSKKKEIPNPNNLYENDPPGWNSFKKEIQFESVQKSRSDQSFDKLVELFKREVRKMPTDIADVLNCYEKLKHSNRKTDETEKTKFKTALENYVSRNRALKNRQTVLDNLDEQLLIKALQKATEMVNLGSLASSPDGLDNVLDAINDFMDAVENHHAELLLPNGGEKRSLTSDKIQQVKKRRTLAQCRFKGKGKLTPKGKQYTGKRNAKKSPQTSDPSEEAREPLSTPHLYDGIQSSPDHSPHCHGIPQDDVIAFPISDIYQYTKILTETTSQDGGSPYKMDLVNIEECTINTAVVNQPGFNISLEHTNYFNSSYPFVSEISQDVNMPPLSSGESSMPTLNMLNRANHSETDSYQPNFQDDNGISESILNDICIPEDIVNNFFMSNPDICVEDKS